QAQHTATHADTSAELYDVYDALHEMELTRVISAHLPIVNTTIVGRMLGLLQKVTRRLLRWYINPIVEQQNMYNDAVMRTMREIVAAYESNALPQTHPPTPSATIPTTSAGHDVHAIQAQLARNEPPMSAHTLALLHLESVRNMHLTVHAHWPLPAQKPLDHVANIIHKLQRMLLRWYINPIVEQINAHNRATQRAIQLLIHYITAKRLPAKRHD
ncbi:MAG: hypothetical protein ACKO83_14995, partial [Roseiflexaceae bacterium]